MYGLFNIIPESRLAWFSNERTHDEPTLQEYNLLGKIVSLAIYNSITISLNFPLYLFKKLISQLGNKELEPTLCDLKELDPILARSLNDMLIFDGNVENVFCCNFQVQLMGVCGERISVDLCENAENTPVTNSNRIGKSFLLIPT